MQVLLCRSVRVLQKFFSYSVSCEYPFYDITLGHSSQTPPMLPCLCVYCNLRNVEILSLCKYYFLHHVSEVWCIIANYSGKLSFSWRLHRCNFHALKACLWIYKEVGFFLYIICISLTLFILEGGRFSFIFGSSGAFCQWISRYCSLFAVACNNN